MANKRDTLLTSNIGRSW